MPFTVAALSALTLLTSLTGLAPAEAFSLGSDRSSFQVAQRSTNLNNAAEVCTDQAEARGLRVQDVLSVTPVAGGAEVTMRVGQRQQNSYTVGCDYSNNTGQVQLYRLEGENTNRTEQYDNDSTWRNSYAGEIRSRSDAESVARQVGGNQLNRDTPFSNLVRIDDVDRDGNQSWEVKGRANGAPFVVRLRASDASVLDFDLQ